MSPPQRGCFAQVSACLLRWLLLRVKGKATRRVSPSKQWATTPHLAILPARLHSVVMIRVRDETKSDDNWARVVGGRRENGRGKTRLLRGSMHWMSCSPCYHQKMTCQYLPFTQSSHCLGRCAETGC
jgi:hypothetical protein